MLKNLLEDKRCFKLICGAGNENEAEVEKLVALYASAGCRFFDLSAKENIVDCAKRGLEYAGVSDAELCVSVGIKGDPHVSKAVIDYEKCIQCGHCESVCPQGAIKYAKVKKLKCIGCGKCSKVCPKNAVSYISEDKDLSEVIPPLAERGISCIEFHVIGEDTPELEQKWKYLNENFDGILSISINRMKLSGEEMVSRIKKMTENRAPYSTIIQADGFPMSGGADDYKSTLQAVATAELIQNEKLPVYILLSGGTNSKSKELAKLCGININGVAVGSYARNIVRKYIERDDFLTNKEIFSQAKEIAQALVRACS